MSTIRQSESLDLLASALAAAQQEFEAVPKTADNPFFKSKYADLASVVLAATPILTKHGLSVTQFPDFDGTNDLLTTTLLHKSGQWIQSTARLHLIKTDPQAQGSATTYMRRYAYCAAVGIVTEVDDDGNRAGAGYRAVGEPTGEQPKRAPAASSSRPSRAGPSDAPTGSQLKFLKSLAAERGLLSSTWEEEESPDLSDLNAFAEEAVGESLEVLTKRGASNLIDAVLKLPS